MNEERIRRINALNLGQCFHIGAGWQHYGAFEKQLMRCGKYVRESIVF